MTPRMTEVRNRYVTEIKQILSGQSDRFLFVIGPCSADREDAVMDYLFRLRRVQDRVSDKILIVPRVYTNKPRTTGAGYKGMLHQPDPNAAPDLLRGVVAARKLHLRALGEADFGCADEMLYPENHRYFSDLLAYTSVGARSVEDQQHRMTASGLDIPVGMKNPTGGSLAVMLHSIEAAQSSHVFLYRGWEVKSEGNPFAHGILRGYTDLDGKNRPNYRADDLLPLMDAFAAAGIDNPALLIDTNHDNSGKRPEEQIAIAREVLAERKKYPAVGKLVKGLMVESYLEGGNQRISPDDVYGRSITDPCLGWDETERLLLDFAENL